jgi:hypothetical protein
MRYILILSLFIGKISFAQTDAINYQPVLYLESSFSFGVTPDAFNTINFGGVFGAPVTEHFWLGIGGGYNKIIDKNFKGGLVPVFLELSNYRNKHNPKLFQSLRVGIITPGTGISPYLGFRTGRRKQMDEYLSCAFFMGMDITKMRVIISDPYINNGRSRAADKFLPSVLAGLNLSF